MNLAKEQLQNAYLQAVAAAACCSLAKPTPDVDGIDWQVTYRAKQPAPGVDPLALLMLQLKATSRTLSSLEGKQTFPLRLSRGHFNHLNVVNPTTPRLLIAMIVPDDISLWIEATHNAMSLRHCCFWANLAGKTASGATSTVNVRTDHIFDDVSLCEIMCQIGKNQVPV